MITLVEEEAGDKRRDDKGKKVRLLWRKIMIKGGRRGEGRNGLFLVLWEEGRRQRRMIMIGKS